MSQGDYGEDTQIQQPVCTEGPRLFGTQWKTMLFGASPY